MEYKAELDSDLEEYPHFEQITEAMANCRYEMCKEHPKAKIKKIESKVFKALTKEGIMYRIKIKITFDA